VSRGDARSQVTWVATAWLAVGLGWAFAPSPDAAPPLVGQRQDAWQQPSLPRPVDQTSAAANVVGAAFWGAPAAAAAAAAGAAPPVVDDRWRISALFGVGSKRGVLVSFSAEGKPAQRLQVGDKLPSGHRITAIGDRDICVQIGQRSYRLGVERSDP
jgi:hypothetical protein